MPTLLRTALVSALLGALLTFTAQRITGRWHARDVNSAVEILVCNTYEGIVVIHRDGTQVGLSADQLPADAAEHLVAQLGKENHAGVVSVPCLTPDTPDPHDFQGDTGNPGTDRL